jgi:hypothetical protein
MIVQLLMYVKKRKWMMSLVKYESNMVIAAILPFISLILFVTPYNVDINQRRIVFFFVLFEQTSNEIGRIVHPIGLF